MVREELEGNKVVPVWALDVRRRRLVSAITCFLELRLLTDSPRHIGDGLDGGDPPSRGARR